MTTASVWFIIDLTSPRTVVFFGPFLNELEGPGLVVQSGSLVLSGL